MLLHAVQHTGPGWLPPSMLTGSSVCQPFQDKGSARRRAWLLLDALPAGHLDLGPTHTPVGGSGLTTGTPTGVGTPGTGSMGGGVPGPGSGSGTPGTGSTGGGVPGSDA